MDTPSPAWNDLCQSQDLGSWDFHRRIMEYQQHLDSLSLYDPSLFSGDDASVPVADSGSLDSGDPAFDSITNGLSLEVPKDNYQGDEPSPLENINVTPPDDNCPPAPLDYHSSGSFPMSENESPPSFMHLGMGGAWASSIFPRNDWPISPTELLDVDNIMTMDGGSFTYPSSVSPLDNVPKYPEPQSAMILTPSLTGGYLGDDPVDRGTSADWMSATSVTTGYLCPTPTSPLAQPKSAMNRTTALFEAQIVHPGPAFPKTPPPMSSIDSISIGPITATKRKRTATTAKGKRKRAVEEDEKVTKKLSKREENYRDKPQKCPVCGEGFPYKREMRRHMVSNHRHKAEEMGIDVSRWCCSVNGCKKDFARKDHLTRHQKDKHLVT